MIIIGPNVIAPAVYNIQQGAIHHIRPRKKHNSSKTETRITSSIKVNLSKKDKESNKYIIIH